MEELKGEERQVFVDGILKEEIFMQPTQEQIIDKINEIIRHLKKGE